MSDNLRKIHTGLYTNRAEQIMRLLLLSEQRQQEPMKHTFKVKSMLYLDIERNIDNEVVFICKKFGGWTTEKTCFFRNSDTDALNHIAWCFKSCVLRRLAKQLPNGSEIKENWNRSATLKFSIESSDVVISVSEAYFIYDHLRQRKNAAKRYSKEMSDSLIGIPLDPIMTEMKIGMYEEIERLKSECDKAVAKLYNDKEQAIRKYTDTVMAKYLEDRKALNAETSAKIAKIKADLAAMTAAAAT